MTLYGISNCDTVRKARKFLETHQIDFHFHDFRKDGLTPDIIQAWLNHVDYDVLINKRSTTWKQLSDPDKTLIENRDWNFLCQHPTLIKRPILQLDQNLLVGFNLKDYQSL